MCLRKLLGLGIIVLFIVSCGAPKSILSYKENARSAAIQKDYVKATDAWKQYFSTNKIEDVSGLEFAQAAQSAFYSGDSDGAVKWYDQARYKQYSDAEMYLTLAGIFNEKDNISKELNALEYYRDSFRSDNNNVNSRIFDLYYEIGLLDSALNVWAKLEETSRDDLTRMNNYFLLQKKMKNDLLCDSLAQQLLVKAPGNINALDWNARKFYLLGEERYLEGMEKYEQNKTTRQYKILVKELDRASEDYKKALSYFNLLWDTEDGKKYASYIANIYARFGDKEKSNYYKGFLK